MLILPGHQMNENQNNKVPLFNHPIGKDEFRSANFEGKGGNSNGPTWIWSTHQCSCLGAMCQF